MTTSADWLALALQYDKIGDFVQEERCYSYVLQSEPDNAEAWHLFGLLRYQQGQVGEARDYVQQALRLRPDLAAAHANLGMMYAGGDETEKAIACFRQALRLRPDLATAHANLGMMYAAGDETEKAIACFRQALALDPGMTSVHANLGLSYALLGRYEEAIAIYQEGLRLQPDCAGVHANLGLCYARLGRHEEAITIYEEGLRRHPDWPEAHFNMGEALAALGRTSEAVAGYRQALRLRPTYAEVFSHLASALVALRQYDQAVLAGGQAVQMEPTGPGGHFNLGIAFMNLGRAEEAQTCFQTVLRLRADFPEAYLSLGNVLQGLGRYEEAEAAFREELRLRPDAPDPLVSLGHVLRDQGRHEEALACFAEVLRVNPDNAEARANRGMALLGKGDFQQAWPDYEFRLLFKGAQVRSYPQPPWDGGPFHNRSILLAAEQGLGDTLQFVRYAPLVKERGGRVILECQPSLRRLLASCPGVDQIVPQGAPLPQCDFHVRLMSLPGILGTTLENIPADIPYLAADPVQVEMWRAVLARRPGFKVGICWQGNPAHVMVRRRLVPLEQFASLARVPGICLVSLQQGAGSEQLECLDDKFSIWKLLDRCSDPAEAWQETAALVRALDLVITVDTAPAHLSGALGVPVWVLLPSAPCWRWLRDRQDSPWYPTMRLFRQSRPGDWESVLARVAELLRSISQP